MPYQLRITDTRPSNTSQWYPGNITFELYRKNTYQDTGKLTIQQKHALYFQFGLYSRLMILSKYQKTIV